MALTRRRLLIGGTLSAAATALAPAVSTAERFRPLLQSGFSGDDWSSVRSQFDLTPEYIHLGLFSLTSHPRPVRQAVEQLRQRLDRNPFLTVEQGMFEPGYPKYYAAVTESLGRYAQVDPNDIALTCNTTSGLSLIYHGLPLRPGDEILTTNQDHYVHHEAIRLASERSGATWRKVAIFDSYDAISADQITDRIKMAIGPKTRVVGITWVHSSSGLRMPIRQIADAIVEVNRSRAPADQVLLAVDGVHGIGVEDADLSALGPDLFAAGLHKWMFAPRGTGFVWAKPDIWSRMRPLMASFQWMEEFDAWANERSIQPPARAALFSPGGFQAYEHHWAVPAAIEFHRKIGSRRITERIHLLNAQMREGLSKMPHVVVYTPAAPELNAGLVCFDVKGLKAEETVHRLLSKRILASTTPYRIPFSRVACGIMNTPEEVDTTLKVVRSLA